MKIKMPILSLAILLSSFAIAYAANANEPSNAAYTASQANYQPNQYTHPNQYQNANPSPYQDQNQYQNPYYGTYQTPQLQPVAQPVPVMEQNTKKNEKKTINLACLDLGFGGMDKVYNDFIYGLGMNSISGLTKGDVFKAGVGYRIDIYTNFLREYTDSNGEKQPGHSVGIDTILGATVTIQISDMVSLGTLVGPEINMEFISSRLLNFGFGSDFCLCLDTGGPIIGFGASIKIPAVKFWNLSPNDEITSPMLFVLPYIGLEL